MLKKYGSVAGMLAAGMLVGGLFGAGCDGSGGEPCVTDDDCSIAGETCQEGLLSSTCGCNPNAATDQCTEADALTICHPDRKGCEQGCTKDEDCTGGETCDLTTSACRDPNRVEPNSCVRDTDCEIDEECKDSVCVLKNANDICAELTCGTGQVCDLRRSSNACVDECVSDLDCDGDDTCDKTTGLCQEGIPAEGCTDDIDCADGDGFCNKTSGQCETALDISECSTTPRQYVNPTTNQCVATAGSLDQCAPASKRDSSRPETAKGPTVYRAEPFKLDPTGCDGTAPLIWFFADYYSADNNANIASPYGALRLLRKADGQTKGNEGQGYMVVCKAGSQSECDGVVSTKTEGRILFSVCRASLEDDSGIAIYLGGKEGSTEYWGNTMCIDIETKYLKD